MTPADAGEPLEGAWSVAVAAQAALGERPVWDERTGSLVWVDIQAGAVHRFTPGGDDGAVKVADSVGFVALREGGGLVFGTEQGLVLADATGAVREDPIVPAGMTAEHFFNDGAVDPAGRLFAGTVTQERTAGAAELYRLDPDGSTHTVLGEVTESNGIAWSGDGRRMYYVDSGGPDLVVFGYDPTDATVTGGEVLIHVEADDGVPDGLIVDAEDNLWLAVWGASCVRCYSPQGELLRSVALPATDITCAAFGGPDLTDLYVTSSRSYLEPDALAAQPHAGDVFVVRPGATGVPSARFGG